MSPDGTDQLARVLSSLQELDLQDEITEREQGSQKFGGSCDIFIAWSKRHDRKVAVKRIRVYLRNDHKFAKKLAREIRIWAGLKHECVLPLLGYFTEGSDSIPSLVSPWMEKGTLDDFMKPLPRGGTDTLNMLTWIVLGLEYLHEQGVVHADLKSKNILVSSECKPLLADFGLSSALETSATLNSTVNTNGTMRWMAIELFDVNPVPAEETRISHTVRSDIWAFGMVVNELLSGQIPYHMYRSDVQVMQAIVKGEKPTAPTVARPLKYFQPLWKISQSCWKTNPTERPTVHKLTESFSKLYDTYPGSSADRVGGSVVPKPAVSRKWPKENLRPISHVTVKEICPDKTPLGAMRDALQVMGMCKDMFDNIRDSFARGYSSGSYLDSTNNELSGVYAVVDELQNCATLALDASASILNHHEAFAHEMTLLFESSAGHPTGDIYRPMEVMAVGDTLVQCSETLSSYSEEMLDCLALVLELADEIRCSREQTFLSRKVPQLLVNAYKVPDAESDAESSDDPSSDSDSEPPETNELFMDLNILLLRMLNRSSDDDQRLELVLGILRNQIPAKAEKARETLCAVPMVRVLVEIDKKIKSGECVRISKIDAQSARDEWQQHRRSLHRLNQSFQRSRYKCEH